jgi:hypothetical protein
LVRILKSITGAVFAALYALAFIAAYIDYLNSSGGWIADIWLVLIALPFTLVMRFLAGGSYDFGGADTGTVIAAAIFCCALVWLCGALLEALARLIVGVITRYLRR